MVMVDADGELVAMTALRFLDLNNTASLHGSSWNICSYSEDPCVVLSTKQMVISSIDYSITVQVLYLFI